MGLAKSRASGNCEVVVLPANDSNAIERSCGAMGEIDGKEIGTISRFIQDGCCTRRRRGGSRREFTEMGDYGIRGKELRGEHESVQEVRVGVRRRDLWSVSGSPSSYPPPPGTTSLGLDHEEFSRRSFGGVTRGPKANSDEATSKKRDEF